MYAHCIMGFWYLIIQRAILLGFFCALCRPHNAGQDKIDTRQCNAVAPELVLCRIRIRVSQPFADLLLRFRLLGMGHKSAVRFKHILPESHIRFRGILGSEVTAPPVRKAL